MMRNKSTVFVLLLVGPAFAAELGTSFTYQGRLQRDTALVSDTCDICFSLYDAAGGGNLIGTTQCVNDVMVDMGLFTVQLNGGGEFSANAFDGNDRWLSIDVKCGAETLFTDLGRQPLTAGPYALQARKLRVTEDGDVGIRTSSPNRPLTIAGSGGSSEWISLLTNSGGNAWHLNNLDGGLNMAESDAAEGRLYLAPGGNVGIGTTTPGEKLTVAGTIAATVGGFRFPDASLQTTAAFGDITGVNAGPGLGGGGSSGDVELNICGGCVTGTMLGTDSVDSPKIINDSISSVDIGPGAVGSSEVADGDIHLIDLAANSVNSGKIVNDEVKPSDLERNEASLIEVSGGWMSAATEGSYNRVTVDPGPSTNRGALRVEAMDAQVMLALNSNCPTGSANPPGLVAALSYNNCGTLFSSNFGGFAIQRRLDDDSATYQQTWLSIDGANGWTWVVPNDASGQTTVPFRVGYNTSNGNGAHVTTGGMWTSTSDKATKTAFAPIDVADILKKVAELPISQWRYHGEPEAVKHVGPVAQDFHAAFGLGDSDRHIGMLDADGVVLAAIQGLHEVVNEKECRIEELEAKLASLEALVAKLADSSNGGGR